MANENHKGGKGASAAARAKPPPLPVEPPQKILPPLTTPVFAVPLTDPPDLFVPEVSISETVIPPEVVLMAMLAPPVATAV